MALATVETLLPPLRWAEIMGINPWEFGQIELSGSGACGDGWFQYGWQTGGISREEVAQAIVRAEFMFAQNTGFWPAPKYIEGEIALYPRVPPGLYGKRSADPYSAAKGVPVRWQHVRAAGKLARTLIEDNAEITLSDRDGDGIDDTFTVIVPTTLLTPAEIGVYVRADDRLGQQISEAWRLRPVHVKTTGVNATITGHIALVGKPALLRSAAPAKLDLDTPADFLTHVSVYRIYTDTSHSEDNQAQGYAMWERYGCDDVLNDDCLQGAAPVCVGDRFGALARLYVRFDLCDLGFEPAYAEPDKVVLNYVAGYPATPQGDMDPAMADIIAHLATALLPAGTCGCDRADLLVGYWQKRTPPDQLSSLEEINNPFGPQNGAVYAWRRVREITTGQTVTL